MTQATSGTEALRIAEERVEHLQNELQAREQASETLAEQQRNAEVAVTTVRVQSEGG